MRKLGIQVVCIVVGWFLLSFTPMGLAAEDNVIRTQGLINPGGNLKMGYLFINETRIYIDQKTQTMDHRGGLIPVSELKPKKWVYMEVENDPIKQTFKAKKIYLLPHYVNPNEKQKFSFMK